MFQIVNFKTSLQKPSIAFSLLSLVAVGCGGSGESKSRVALEGEIKLNGKSLPTGLVSFLPTDDKGQTAIAQIENGKYNIDRSNGPAIGTYKVLINSRQPTGRKVRDIDNPAIFISEEREVVPAQYNNSSTLTIEIKADGKQDFELKSSVKPVAVNTRGR